MTPLVEEIVKIRQLRCPDTGIVVSVRHEDNQGRLHNEDGQALIKRDRRTALDTLHHYAIHGQTHRSGGEPAVEEFDPQSGTCIWRAWQENGDYTRINGLPHVERVDPQTGVIVEAQYRIKNASKKGYALHNENSPARILYDRITGEQISAEYHRFGQKQRSPDSQVFRP